MTERMLIPVALRVLAWLFVITGVWAIADTIVGAFNHRYILNFGVLGLIIGIGLLRLAPAARAWALVLSYFTLVSAAAVAVFVVLAPGEGEFSVFGKSFGEAPRSAGVALAVVAILVALWQIRVLTKGEVRELFGKSSA